MSTMLDSLMEGGGLMGKAERPAVGRAPAGTCRCTSGTTGLQQIVVERAGLAGTVPTPKTGNLTAVYTQNGNGSKVDVFQQRTVDETVRLRADGSALVRRTVRSTNHSPPYTGHRPGHPARLRRHARRRTWSST